ncbi:hypothetical protein ACOME3_008006 [Neoechinorhynchus agilis]
MLKSLEYTPNFRPMPSPLKRDNLFQKYFYREILLLLSLKLNPAYCLNVKRERCNIPKRSSYPLFDYRPRAPTYLPPFIAAENYRKSFDTFSTRPTYEPRYAQHYAPVQPTITTSHVGQLKPKNYDSQFQAQRPMFYAPRLINTETYPMPVQQRPFISQSVEKPSTPFRFNVQPSPPVKFHQIPPLTVETRPPPPPMPAQNNQAQMPIIEETTGKVDDPHIVTENNIKNIFPKKGEHVIVLRDDGIFSISRVTGEIAFQSSKSSGGKSRRLSSPHERIRDHPPICSSHRSSHHPFQWYTGPPGSFLIHEDAAIHSDRFDGWVPIDQFYGIDGQAQYVPQIAEMSSSDEELNYNGTKNSS